jgi:hypothetical protein
MCSLWRGFAPLIDSIRERVGLNLPIRLIMGGFCPGAIKPMDEVAKRTTREHREHVREAAGQPFDISFFDREGFVYDTQPAAKAVGSRGSMDLAGSPKSAPWCLLCPQPRPYRRKMFWQSLLPGAAPIAACSSSRSGAKRRGRRLGWTLPLRRKLELEGSRT